MAGPAEVEALGCCWASGSTTWTSRAGCGSRPQCTDQRWVPGQPGAWYVRKIRVSPDQRIPVALRRSEAELLSSRISLTLEQVEQLLDYVQRCFTDGREY